MPAEDHLMTPETLAASDGSVPLALIDLDACPSDAAIPDLPPFPLIGFGDGRHPLADRMDALLEPRFSAEPLVANLLRAPRAAAALVSLLRGIDGLDVGSALAMESICYAMLQGSAEHARWLADRHGGQEHQAGAVLVERRDAVLHVTLDRASARNTIDRPMRDALHEAFTLAALDREIASVRLRARGRAFSVGADLAEFGTTRDPATAHLIRARTLPALALARRPGILDVHVRGACVGAGLEIAAFARRFTASEDAWFQLPELAMGIIPGAGGCVSVSRRIGRQRAALMVLSGRRIDPRTALRWGLIDAITGDEPGDQS